MNDPFTIQLEDRGSFAVPTIYAIGRNYAEHALELGNPLPKGEPVVFLKAPSSLRGLNAETLAFPTETFHHEIELVLRVGRDHALGQVAGWNSIDAVALGLDMTRREAQSKLKTAGLPWTTAKSFAGSAIVSPFISKEKWEGRTNFSFELLVNGQLRQSGDTKNLLFDVPFILTWLGTFNILREGDLVFTGTPAGVGPMKHGDEFEMRLIEPKRIWRGRL